MIPFWRLAYAACKQWTGSLLRMSYQWLLFPFFLAGKCFALWKISVESCGVLRGGPRTLAISLTLKSSTHWFCFLLAWCVQCCVRHDIPAGATCIMQKIGLSWKVNLGMYEAPSHVHCKPWEDISVWGWLVCLMFLKQVPHYKCWCGGEKGKVRTSCGRAVGFHPWLRGAGRKQTLKK